VVGDFFGGHSVSFAVRKYLHLLRAQHWVKNILVFVPFFFSIGFINRMAAAAVCVGFVCFSLLSSIIYILNDIRDREYDRLHPVKCRRPVASGAVSVRAACLVLVLLAAALAALFCFVKIEGRQAVPVRALCILLLYALTNTAYSFGLKNIPILDVAILASGYVLRVVFGAELAGIEISIWFYLVIMMGALYLGLGKRRNEITLNGGSEESRKVMRFYSHNFLDKNMYVAQTLCIVFYALWSIDPQIVQKHNTRAFVYTIPAVLIILLKYSLNIETGSDGDPTSVILQDKVLLALCVGYALCVFCILTLGRNNNSV
jgi:4-hydroxybenzoate polyprenyltransferase